MAARDEVWVCKEMSAGNMRAVQQRSGVLRNEGKKD